MGFSIVYGGEHYLVDALAGYAYAVAGFLVAERLIGWQQPAAAAPSPPADPGGGSVAVSRPPQPHQGSTAADA